MIKPLNKTNIYEEVIHEIIKLIKDKSWESGEKIPGEIALAEAFNVSRNSVREALKALELSGIITAKAGKGTFLTENVFNNIRRMELTWALRDADSLDELVQTRLIIEPELAALAAQNANSEDIREMNETIEHTIEITYNDKYTIEEGMKFHLRMIKASKNEILTKFMNSIVDELCVHRLLRVKRYTDKKVIIEEMKEHQLIVKLIEEGEVEKVREIVRNHVLRVKDFYYDKE
ncbi:MAG: FadR/GntR family transcriptional regulator [Bacillota bacterium]|nr:FadR/GntR family transcriptional regulator [Bacillota bacterium]